MLSIKTTKPFKKFIKNQDARNTLSFVFALSKRPHFHRAYLATVCKQKLVAVHQAYIDPISKYFCISKVRSYLGVKDNFTTAEFSRGQYLPLLCQILAVHIRRSLHKAP